MSTTKTQTVTIVEFTPAELATMLTTHLGTLRAQDTKIDIQGNVTFSLRGLDFSSIQGLPGNYTVQHVSNNPAVALRVIWASDNK